MRVFKHFCLESLISARVCILILIIEKFTGFTTDVNTTDFNLHNGEGVSDGGATKYRKYRMKLVFIAEYDESQHFESAAIT